MRICTVIFLLLATTTSYADSVKDRLSRLEQKLSSKAYLEIWQSVEQMRNEIRELRGELEQQSYQLQQIQDQQQQISENLDQRIQAIEKSSVDPTNNQQTTDADQPDPDSTANTLHADSSLNTDLSPTIDQATIQANYDNALKTLRSGHYDDASVLFKQIVTQYSNSDLADNAQYWLAETMYINRDFEMASSAFQKIIDNYPDSSKVPDAYLKIAFIQFEINKTSTGKKLLQTLIQDYPDSSAAKLAEKRLNLNR